jgi:hypothetical protein
VVTAEETVQYILDAQSWDERVARIRLVPGRHGTDEHAGIYARVAQKAYVPHLGADFAYVHPAKFYDLPHFQHSYEAAAEGTAVFTRTSVDELTDVLRVTPHALLALRTITGLGRNEFAAVTALVAGPLGSSPLSSAKVDSVERSGSSMSEAQARVAAEALAQVMDGTLFGEPPGDLRTKQDKPDTAEGWASVQRFAVEQVPYSTFLHQRHYGGAFRQVLDATSERRGNLIEDAVEALFVEHDVPFIRTGSHNQADIAERFEVTVTPAPDFVVFDASDRLQAMLECKGANDGGTARDKALRFKALRTESLRLGGVPLLAVLAGLGWARVNDTLGPVVRDCDGRVFTLATLPEMVSVAPFASLKGLSGTNPR